MRIALLIARAILAAVFFYSGFYKIGIGESFALTIFSFGMVPLSFAHGMAMVLPSLEVVAAILLVLPKVHRVGAAITAALCIIFLIALGWALWHGILVDCGCFGESAPSFQKMWLAVYRDIFLLAISLFVLFCGNTLRTLPEKLQ